MYRNWIYYLKKTHKTFVILNKKLNTLSRIQNYVYKTRGKKLIIMRLDGKIMMNNLLQTYTKEAAAAAAKQEDSFIIHIFYCNKCTFNKA